MNLERAKSFIRRWGPDILSGLATVGVVVTAYLSGRAAVKASKKETKKEKAKCYIPTVVAGAITIASIWGSRTISARQLASMTAAAGYFVAKKKKVDELKEDEKTKPVSVEETGFGDVLCLESFSGRWFRSSVESVEQACHDLDTIYKHDMEEKGYSARTLNELYFLLGIQTTYFGEKVIWCNEQNGEDIIFANQFVDWGDDVGEVYVIELIDESMPKMVEIEE